MNLDRVKSVVSLMTADEKAELCAADGQYRTKEQGRLKVPVFTLNAQFNGLEPSDAWLTVAATFDKDLCAEAARLIAKRNFLRGEIFGGIVSLAVTRNPFSPLSAYTFGEDAYLTAQMADAAVSVEGLKWAGENPLGEGEYFDRWIDERALEEIYLAPLKKVGKKLGCLVLPSGRLNGVYVNQQKGLIDKISSYLDKQTLLSVSCPVGQDSAHRAALGLYSLTPSDAEPIKTAVKNGTLDERRVGGILEKLIYAGVLYHQKAKEGAAHASTAEVCDVEKRVASESAVLLKNDGLLPLKSLQGVAFIGDLESLGAEGKELSKSRHYARGYEAGQKAEPSLIKKAVALNKESVCSVVILTALGGKLSDGEKTLIEELSRTGKDFVAVIVSPFGVEFAYDYAFKTILFMPSCGTFTLTAMAEILTGKVNPSGKLPFTWAAAESDYPTFASERCKGADMLCYESVFNGYKYFQQFNITPLYPFGHGLSYCKADITSLKTECNEDTLRISFVVKNMGDMPAKFGVQAYIETEGNKIMGLNRRLAGFKKVSLEKTENTSVQFDVDLKEFAVYNTGENVSFIPGGRYTVLVGFSSADIRAQSSVKVPKPARYTLPLDANSAPSYFKNKDFKPLGAEIEKVLGCSLLAAMQGDAMCRGAKNTRLKNKIFKSYSTLYTTPLKRAELNNKLKFIPDYALMQLPQKPRKGQ